LLLVGKRDGVDEEIQRGHFSRSRAKARRASPVLASQSISAAGRNGSTSGDTRFAKRVALIGKGQLGAVGMQNLRDAPSNRALIRDAP